MNVFVAGSFWQGDTGLQLRRALKVAEEVAAAGHLPFVPQLYYFWHLVSPKRAGAWEELSLGWLGQCQAAIFVRGTSKKFRKKIWEACRAQALPLYNDFAKFRAGLEYRRPVNAKEA